MRIAIALTAGIAAAASAGVAGAGDRPDHDARIAKAAAERAAAKLGDLRGGLRHDAGLSALIEKDRLRTRGTGLPSGPKPSRRAATEEAVLLDRTLTGSALPDGVDPMITGANQ